MKTQEQNGQPSIQQIVFTQDKILKQNCINKLFKKSPQRCFQTAQLKKDEALMKNWLFSSMVKELESWNLKVSKNEHNVDSRRQLTRNMFIFTGLKRIMNMQQNQKSEQVSKLHDWFQKYIQYRPATTQTRINKKQYEDAWHVRKTFKHNMQAQINSYRRRTFASPQNQINKVKQENPINLKMVKEGSYKTIMQTEPSPCQQRFNMDQLRLHHNRVRKYRQFKDISQAQNRFSQQKSRYIEHQYKNFWEGKFRPDDIWQSNLAKKKDLIQSQKILNTQISIKQIKRRRIHQVLRQKKLNRFSQNKAESFNNIEGIDGYNLLRNPFEVPIKKKKRR